MQDAVRAHGEGAVVFEPRVHLVPDNGGAGHFNVLRGHLSGPGAVSGIKVVGDFHRTGSAACPAKWACSRCTTRRPGHRGRCMDATLITACRTGAMTAVGARFLARPDARVLGHAGSRGTAFWNVTLLDALFGLDEIRVTSARPGVAGGVRGAAAGGDRHPGAGDRLGRKRRSTARTSWSRRPG